MLSLNENQVLFLIHSNRVAQIGSLKSYLNCINQNARIAIRQSFDVFKLESKLQAPVSLHQRQGLGDNGISASKLAQKLLGGLALHRNA